MTLYGELQRASSEEDIKDAHIWGVDVIPVSFADFETAYKRLSEKLRPCVYEYGFLR